jgi:diguanylate cyclase (GGDEF)-like protein/PAS domain S-box-containing protein
VALHSGGSPRPNTNEPYDSLLDELNDGVYFVDRQRRIQYWNKACERLSGYTAEQVIGSSCADGLLMHVDETGRCLCQDGCPLASVMTDGCNRDVHVYMHHADGHRVPVHVRAAPVRDRHGNIVGAVEVFSDDTDRVGVLERLAELEESAMIDELTGLANRRFFNRALNASLAEAERHQTPFGLILIDVDHFKRFNDTYGHDVGDRVLSMVGRTLARTARAYDTPARWGGEEFAVIAQRIDAEGLQVLAERLRNLIAESALDVQGQGVRVTVSLGVAMVQPGEAGEAAMKRADQLLYASKQAGRNRATFDPDLLAA